MTESILDPRRNAEISDHFLMQAVACIQHDSPLYASLMRIANDDLERGGPMARLFRDWKGHPTKLAVSMRLCGAVHALVLSGRAPELAKHYPTAGGRPDESRLARDFVNVLDAHEVEIRSRLDEQVQTNEVRRSTALLGGFLHVASATELPLALHEFGSSAGLNQHFDRHRYELGPHRFGRTEAALTLESDWSGPPPALDARLEIAARGGCDLAPMDLEDPIARARLESFVWGDQPERLERLRRAIGVARENGTRIDTGRAIEWLSGRLEAPAEGMAHVVFHSSVWWYLPADERAAVTRLMESAGERATTTRPLAWLRMEGDDLEFADIRLRLWPTGEDVHLGRARYHGQAVEWFGTGSAAVD